MNCLRELLCSFETQPYVNHVAMTPDGTRLAAGSYGGDVYPLDGQGERGGDAFVVKMSARP